ncbi:Glycosyltransferase involved in cell wall bisynthesis [Pseudobutyrivibrio sp. YE44]|uniref:glycosyltransferase family 2 protein n=1 Tax=Pseudobutyrivibrio sp. YE44 TaxID=1520802 RepID=UPI000886733C|nr:glycosyltransferase family 2 protein [Pseudobutyrivibrio sp. YE44]SDB28906.1 Glycosyltransferase involved in cell wall bisynthesis [Pseudobutyrivibrio sp. YE44]
MEEEKVSIVMPTYNAAARLIFAIDSVLAQTYSNWELIIVNEATTCDETAEIAISYRKKDSRIKLIQNKKKEGLAESLNIGIQNADGKYIARLDADDLAHKERIEKQVKYLEENDDVGVLGTWQHHFGKSDWVHAPARKYDKCRAILLFDCNMCHSTVMMRRKLFSEQGFSYDKNSSIEDFKLWTELMRVTKIENLPEILGEYYEGESNISNEKLHTINAEYPLIVGESLRSIFGIEIKDEDRKLFEFKASLITPDYNLEDKLKTYCYEIYARNKEVKFSNNAVMMHVLHYWWVREHTGDILFNNKIETYDSIDDIFFID